MRELKLTEVNFFRVMLQVNRRGFSQTYVGLSPKSVVYLLLQDNIRVGLALYYVFVLLDKYSPSK